MYIFWRTHKGHEIIRCVRAGSFYMVLFVMVPLCIRYTYVICGWLLRKQVLQHHDLGMEVAGKLLGKGVSLVLVGFVSCVVPHA